MAYRKDGVIVVPLLVRVGHVEDVVKRFQRPLGGIFQAERCQQEHASAGLFTSAQEGVAFLVACKAQDGELRIHLHIMQDLQ